jgi:5-methyltetrahydrofolate--homocysteine methyltransferase
MEDVASRLQSEGLSIPLFVGGATTSALHTALKLSPLYQGLVCWTNDASQLAVKALKLLNEKERNELYDHTQQEYAAICQQHQVKKLASIEEARAHKLNLY